MKEVLKNICEMTLEIFKHNELGNYFTKSPTSNQMTKNQKYNLFMSHIGMLIFDEIIAKDFDLSKYTIYNDFVSSCISTITDTDYFYEINFYHIPKINTLFFFIDEESSSFDGGANNVFNFIQNNYQSFINQIYSIYKIDKTEDEFYELFADCKFVLFSCTTPISFLTNNPNKNDLHKLCKDSPSTNVIDILKELYGDNKKLENYIKIIENYRLKALELIYTSQTDLIKQNQNEFCLGLWRSVYREYKLLSEKNKQTNHNNKYNLKVYFSNEDLIRIETKLLNTKNIDKISKMLYTFFYTRKLFLEHMTKNEAEYFDLTFIVVSLFKVVEILFNELLSEKWPNLYVVGKHGKIKFSDEKLTLGEMKQIFEEDKDVFVPDEVRQHLNNKGVRKNELKILLSRWISKTRNGFLHKDIIEINKDMIDSSISDSIEIICLLLLVLD